MGTPRPAPPEGEPLYSFYASAPPTRIQRHFAEWLAEHTGYEVDVQSVAIAKALHQRWQESPERQAMIDASRNERAALREATPPVPRRRRGRPPGSKNKPKSAAAAALEESFSGTEPVLGETEMTPASAAPPAAKKPARARKAPQRAAPPEPELDDEDGSLFDDEGPGLAASGQPKVAAASRGRPATRRRTVAAAPARQPAPSGMAGPGRPRPLPY